MPMACAFCGLLRERASFPSLRLVIVAPAGNHHLRSWRTDQGTKSIQENGSTAEDCRRPNRPWKATGGTDPPASAGLTQFPAPRILWSECASAPRPCFLVVVCGRRGVGSADRFPDTHPAKIGWVSFLVRI